MTGRKVLMNFEVTPTSHTLEAYLARGGYQTIQKVLREMKPADVTAEVTAAGIQGRGGAAFPAGRKWQVVDPHDGQEHFLIANADEGEPGTFKDRWVLEHTPHTLVESMLIAAYALAVRNCFVYIRGEFDRPYRHLAAAVEEAYAAGYLGENIFGSGFSCHLYVFRGAGAYVCGEASSLLASVEGSRGYPRNRPPRLTVKGLFQLPTVVNNVETLSNLTWILQHGAAEYQKLGAPKSPGTRLISISGHITRPGTYEVEMGYPWSKFLEEDCGGILNGRKLKAIIPGGISSQVLTPETIYKLNLDHYALWDVGSSLGSGGMIVIAEGTCMVSLLRVMLRFYHHESCGQCTPCRDGMGWANRVIDRMLAGEGKPGDIETLLHISKFNDGTTICGLGDAAGYATTAFIEHFRDEFEYIIEHKRSKYDGRLECLPEVANA